MFLINFQPWGNIVMWLVIVIIAVLIEISTYQLVSVWFAGSGLITMVLAAFSCPIEIQVIVFVLLSAILFVLSRPLVKKIQSKKSDNSTVESMIGEEVFVTKTIKVGEVGEIKARYDYYSAIAPLEKNDIPVNTVCIIKEIRGNKVIVEIK